mmetsp:Transcript_95586/g.270421  ORF Transcript_95586/g.270421 Transcript_95586/m.270421 type:complete len:234 (-) Transcript_95586:374-1075(-)
MWASERHHHCCCRTAASCSTSGSHRTPSWPRCQRNSCPSSSSPTVGRARSCCMPDCCHRPVGTPSRTRCTPARQQCCLPPLPDGATRRSSTVLQWPRESETAWDLACLRQCRLSCSRSGSHSVTWCSLSQRSSGPSSSSPTAGTGRNCCRPDCHRMPPRTPPGTRNSAARRPCCPPRLPALETRHSKYRQPLRLLRHIHRLHRWKRCSHHMSDHVVLRNRRSAPPKHLCTAAR